MYVLHISSVSNVCCIQVFHVVRRVMVARHGAENGGAVSRRPTDVAHGALGDGGRGATGRGARVVQGERLGGWGRVESR
jgi:hypothetical protein